MNRMLDRETGVERRVYTQPKNSSPRITRIFTNNKKIRILFAYFRVFAGKFSPTMIRRMAFFYGDKGSSACVADLSVCDQLGLDRGAVLSRFDNASFQRDRAVNRCRTEQFHMKISSNCTRSVRLATHFHQMMRRGPVRMTVEQRSIIPPFNTPGNA